MEYQRRLCLMRFAPSTVAYGRAYRCTPPPRRLRGRRCAPQLWGQRAGRRADAAWAGRAAKTKAAGRRRSMKTSPRSRFSPPPLPRTASTYRDPCCILTRGRRSALCPLPLRLGLLARHRTHAPALAHDASAWRASCRPQSWSRPTTCASIVRRCRPPRTATGSRPRRAPAPPRTKWTRRVPHPVLIGHAAMPPCRPCLGPDRRTARACLGSHASVRLQRSRGVST